MRLTDVYTAIADGEVIWNPQTLAFSCTHRTRHLVRRVRSNGQQVAAKQCVCCGHSEYGMKLKDVPGGIESCPTYDEEPAIRFEAWGSMLRKQLETDTNAEWWAAYDVYLTSRPWKERRVKVLRRAGGTCEACLERPAEEVHHTTYKHLFNEPLWELRAVCTECHESITAADRAASERKGHS